MPQLDVSEIAMIHSIQKFIRKQALIGFVVKMREKLAYEYPKRSTFNQNQIENCINRAGYSKEYYIYGYCLFMTEKYGMKVLRKMEKPERTQSVFREISDILGIQYLWTDQGSSLMKEYLPDKPEHSSPTFGHAASYIYHMSGR